MGNAMNPSRRSRNASLARDHAGPDPCPLCDRPIPPDQRDAHHLIPKSKGGKSVVYLHRMCHRQIHALLTESELATHFQTVEALVQEP